MKKIITEEDKKHIRNLYETHNNFTEFNDVLNLDYLKDLSNQDLKLLFTIEDTHKLPNNGKLGEIKKYILSGKKDFSMSEKINKIEKLTIPIVIDRWLNSVAE